MKRNIILYSIYIMLPVFVVASIGWNPLQAQEESPGQKNSSRQTNTTEQGAATREKSSRGELSPDSPLKNEPPDKYLGVYEHRLRFRLGLGMGTLTPAILNETAKAWMINSLYRQVLIPGAPVAVPVSVSEDLGTDSDLMEVSYGWKRSLHLGRSIHRSRGVYDRNNPATVEFLSPRTSTYWASLFEGNRLLRFDGKEEEFRAAYWFHPYRWLSAGPSLTYHIYTEKNKISYGSYNSSREADRVTWSVGGDAFTEYEMTGFHPGVEASVRLVPWFVIHGRYEMIKRSGTFQTDGSQIVQQNSADSSSLSLLIPYYSGKVRDEGYSILVEASLRYCRFTLDVGVIRKDINRSYDLYLGDTFGNVSRVDYSVRSALIGVAEMSGQFRHTTNEFFIRPGVSFHWDQDGEY